MTRCMVFAEKKIHGNNLEGCVLKVHCSGNGKIRNRKISCLAHVCMSGNF